MKPKLPAALGASPAFDEPLNIVAPLLPPIADVQDDVAAILSSGQLTNDSRFVRAFEAALQQRLGLPAVAVSNGTWALVLALKQLGVEGEVIVPSYTFSASVHAIKWAGATPVFADVLPDTFTVDPEAVRAAITPRTSAIVGVHVYGHPCEIDPLSALAQRQHLVLLFDAAHGFGASYRGAPVGTFGDAECFSFHATKTLPVGEGGCVTTRDAELVRQLRLVRKFGDPGDENTVLVGTNAKMQEFNAILGLAGLRTVDEVIARRRRYADQLRARLSRLPGLTFQHERPYVRACCQNFALLVDDVGFGLTRDETCAALACENVRCRKYFYPPVHRHDAYATHRGGALPTTDRLADRVLCLPFYSRMAEDEIGRLSEVIENIHAHAPRIRRALRSTCSHRARA
jgi:dTDP-4-amino-4,6-dideoxygalactose transaminase